MALNWQHIKGVNGTTPVYTFIEFNDNADADFYTPHIYWNNQNERGNNDLGYIITSNQNYQHIKHHFTFEDDVNINKTLNVANITSTQLIFLDPSDPSTQQGSIQYDNTKHGMHWDTSSTPLYINDWVTFQPTQATFNKIVKLQDGANKAPVITLDPSDGKCEAIYFNATSDERAKDNIMPAAKSALDIIGDLKVCTFNYKDHDEKDVGLIAQHLLDVDYEGVSFVNNPEATGENGDYMSIKESKLVYLLIKAVQEQQAIIDDLLAKIQ